MSPKRIAYIAFICLLFIFVTQAYLVNDFFQTTRSGLVRESDAIVEEVFKRELGQRNAYYKHIMGEDTITSLPVKRKDITVDCDLRSAHSKKDNVMLLIDLAINKFISSKVPMNLHNLDSITEVVLQERGIESDFIINIVDPSSGIVLKQSDKKFNATILMVPSKFLRIDIDNQKSLELVLVNPFNLILQRMGFMLISSLLLSIICVLAFRFLLQTLARQKQLVTFKNDFLATIAHELKRPVASLSLNLDCLSMPEFIENIPKREQLLRKSMHATTELYATINMIVALAKLEEGLLVLNKEPMNLKDLFDELKTKFITDSAKKVVIETVYQLEDFSISADVQLLSQCFANLIDNAIKYSSKEVLVIITLQKTGKWIIISIKDNGYGIPDDKLPVIFDKYMRVHTDRTTVNGFGIGLNYVKTIVEKHKGEVEVKSQLGEGSEFSVLLPEVNS